MKYNDYRGLLSASWEIDIWGKLRRATEAARADLLSSEESRRTVVLTLVASVANAYIELRDLDRQLEISQRTLKSREETYRLFQKRFDSFQKWGASFRGCLKSFLSPCGRGVK